MGMIVGVDPGITGGLALIGPDVAYKAACAMPVDRVGKTGTKMQVDAKAVIHLLQDWGAVHCAGQQATVVIEDVHAMPGQGVTSMFTFGRSVGRLEGALAYFNVPVHYVTPAKWKKHFGLDADKKNALALARRLYPDAPLKLEKSVGMAEALLIARYYREVSLNQK